MIYTVIDIETTGLIRFDQNSVLIPDLTEFGYIRLDYSPTTGLRILDGGALYFYKEDYDVPQNIVELTGITKEFLSQFADEFDDNVNTMRTILANGNIITKNGEGFDIPFITHWLNKRVKTPDLETIVVNAFQSKYDGHGVVYHTADVNNTDLQKCYRDMWVTRKQLIADGKDTELNNYTTEQLHQVYEVGKYATGSKRGKLGEYVESIPGGLELSKQIYDLVPNKDHMAEAHSALFDCAMTLCVWLDMIIYGGKFTW